MAGLSFCTDKQPCFNNSCFVSDTNVPIYAILFETANLVETINELKFCGFSSTLISNLIESDSVLYNDQCNTEKDVVMISLFRFFFRNAYVIF